MSRCENTKMSDPSPGVRTRSGRVSTPPVFYNPSQTSSTPTPQVGPKKKPKSKAKGKSTPPSEAEAEAEVEPIERETSVVELEPEFEEEPEGEEPEGEEPESEPQVQAPPLLPLGDEEPGPGPAPSPAPTEGAVRSVAAAVGSAVAAAAPVVGRAAVRAAAATGRGVAAAARAAYNFTFSPSDVGLDYRTNPEFKEYLSVEHVVLPKDVTVAEMKQKILESELATRTEENKRIVKTQLEGGYMDSNYLDFYMYKVITSMKLIHKKVHVFGPKKPVVSSEKTIMFVPITFFNAFTKKGEDFINAFYDQTNAAANIRYILAIANVRDNHYITYLFDRQTNTLMVFDTLRSPDDHAGHVRVASILQKTAFVETNTKSVVMHFSKMPVQSLADCGPASVIVTYRLLMYSIFAQNFDTVFAKEGGAKFVEDFNALFDYEPTESGKEIAVVWSEGISNQRRFHKRTSAVRFGIVAMAVMQYSNKKYEPFDDVLQELTGESYEVRA